MRLIDADALEDAMYTETMLKDTDMQRWDSGCWIRYKLFENVLREQPTIDAEPRWIPVTERLPKQGQEVICQCRANIIKVLKLDANGDWYQDAEHCYMSGFVVAWMPLPKPYQEEKC